MKYTIDEIELDFDCDTKWMEVTNTAEPEVLTAVFMKSYVF
jgi:hypothetical protein